MNLKQYNGTGEVIKSGVVHFDVGRMKRIEMPFFMPVTAWDYYTDGERVYYIAKPGTGCDSGFFGDIFHLKKEMCNAYIKYANMKGLFLSVSILDIYSIEKLIGNYLKKYTN